MILTEFPPRIGGMQTHAIYLAQALHQKGYDIQVITLRSVNEEQESRCLAFDASLPFPVKRILSRIGYEHNIKLLIRQCQTFTPSLLYASTVFYGKVATATNIPMICRSVGNDVLRPWIVYPFKPLSRVVSTKWFENHLYRFFQRLNYPEPIEMIWRSRRKKLMVESAREIELILANSQFTADLLSDIGVVKTHVEIITGGVDSSRFSAGPSNPSLRQALGIPPDRFVLMTACRMVRKKGVDFLITEMPRLIEKIPDAHLLVVGTGRHYRKFKTMAKKSPAADHITFAGKIAHNDIQQYYRVADIFVLASRIQIDTRTGVRDAETMGRVLCEANAAGIPIVAGRSGGIPSVIQHGINGLLFTPDDMDDLCRCIVSIRSSVDLAQTLHDNGLRLAKEEFDWSVIIQKHEALFQRVITQRSTISTS